MHSLTVSVLLAAAIAAPACGTLYVDPAGDDSDDCPSPATACLTNQAAIHKAPDGETIQVAPGTYAEQVVISNRESLRLQGATRIEANEVGIFMFGGQTLMRPGVRLLQNETGIIDVAGHLQTFGIEITDSLPDGIVMADNASARIQNTTVTGSADDGIELDTLSTLRIFDTAVVEGNGGTDLVCANGSMVRGELGGVRKVSCRRAR